MFLLSIFLFFCPSSFHLLHRSCFAMTLFFPTQWVSRGGRRNAWNEIKPKKILRLAFLPRSASLKLFFKGKVLKLFLSTTWKPWKICSRGTFSENVNGCLLNNKCLGNLGGNRKYLYFSLLWFIVELINAIFYSMEGKEEKIRKQWLYNLFPKSQFTSWALAFCLDVPTHVKPRPMYTNGRIFPTSSICKHQMVHNCEEESVHLGFYFHQPISSLC